MFLFPNHFILIFSIIIIPIYFSIFPPIGDGEPVSQRSVATESSWGREEKIWFVVQVTSSGCHFGSSGVFATFSTAPASSKCWDGLDRNRQICCELHSSSKSPSSWESFGQWRWESSSPSSSSLTSSPASSSSSSWPPGAQILQLYRWRSQSSRFPWHHHSEDSHADQFWPWNGTSQAAAMVCGEPTSF